MFIRATVKAEAKKDQVFPQKEGKFLIQTRQPAKEGKANLQARFLLANHLQVPLEEVKLIRGKTCPHKLFEICHYDHKKN